MASHNTISSIKLQCVGRATNMQWASWIYHIISFKIETDIKLVKRMILLFELWTLMFSDIFNRWKLSADKYLPSPSLTAFVNSSTWTWKWPESHSEGNTQTWPPSRVRWLPVYGSDSETTWTPADGQQLVRQSHLSFNQPNNLITARSESDKAECEEEQH